jgi:DNA invertase Pin-like site-specific DNA recombinase
MAEYKRIVKARTVLAGRWMLIGYARTSTIDQKAGLDAQVAELQGAGVEELFIEQVSSVQKREELEKTLKFIRKGDSLVCTKLDRLARSIPDLVRILGVLEEKQATLRRQLQTKPARNSFSLTLQHYLSFEL